jgi:hypothetical protein
LSEAIQRLGWLGGFSLPFSVLNYIVAYIIAYALMFRRISNNSIMIPCLPRKFWDV